MRIAPWRSLLVLVVLLGCLEILLVGGVFRAVTQKKQLDTEVAKRYYRRLEISRRRGSITDRAGAPLAVSAPTFSVYLDPVAFIGGFGGDRRAREAAIAAIAEKLGVEPAAVSAKVDGGSRRFVYLHKYLPPAEADDLLDLGLPGLGKEEAPRRFYPAGYLTGHVVGFTDYRDQGREGVELARQESLRAEPGESEVLRTAAGEVLEEYGRSGSRDGGDLALTMDVRLQYFAFAALARAVRKHRARAGALVVLDAGGDILAMVNYPSFNPNNLGDTSADARRNRAAVDIFEPGSAMKPIAAALAMERGLIEADTPLDTAEPFAVGSLIVRDENIREDVTVAEMIARSSNKGAVRVAEMLSSEELWRGLRAFGFGAAPGAGFPAESAGLLRHHAKWRPVDHATIGYGHGVSVSLLQLARAYAVFANGGKLPRVSLARGEAKAAGGQVVSAAIAREIIEMMEGVTADGGTAPAARVFGYRVAGKTGTSIKLDAGGRYDRGKSQAIFVGLAPASAPRFVAAVMIDEPQGGRGYGGVVAAPVFAETMARALLLDAVAPDAPGFFGREAGAAQGGDV